MDVDADQACGVAAAAALVGDPWTPLLLRDVARGQHRFEQLLACGVSRKVLAGRLAALVGAGVLDRRRYQERPDRYEYHLSPSGRALLPALVALRAWGDAHLAAGAPPSAVATEEEFVRLGALVGARARVPALDPDPLEPDLVGGAAAWTVLHCYPGTDLPAVETVPAGPGCADVLRRLHDRVGELRALGARVVGVSTQTHVEQERFARATRVWLPLVSDAGFGLTAALGLPTFALGGAHRLKRVTLVVDADRALRGVLCHVGGTAEEVGDVVALVRRVARSAEPQVHDVEPDAPVRP